MTATTCPWVTYAHLSPDGRVFYIGKAKGGSKRPSDFSPSRRTAKHLNAVNKHCHPFVIVAISPAPTEEKAFDDERKWIAKARLDGQPLCNFTDGGEGAAGRVKTKAEIESIRAAALRQWDRQGRKVKPAPKSGVCVCAVCGIESPWLHRPRKVCSKRCESAYYRRRKSP